MEHGQHGIAYSSRDSSAAGRAFQTPSHIYDARYINCFMELPSVQMFGIGKILSSCWKGMFMISMDHKSGYYHVPIHPECWKYFGVSWEDKIYCYAIGIYILYSYWSMYMNYVYRKSHWHWFWIGLTMSFEGPVTW